ncbi:MAG: preprotein translocase subunit SecE [Candidatus Doudnabacteria bacterium]|nr:preprotein translocase subunit SecE [Candidatus Doudnabacteria bacterium]
MIKKITALPKRLGQELQKVGQELRRVDWISRSNAVKSTSIVMFVTIIVILFLVLVDTVLFDIRNIILNRPF